jgi:hypothetical protein
VLHPTIDQSLPLPPSLPPFLPPSPPPSLPPPPCLLTTPTIAPSFVSSTSRPTAVANATLPLSRIVLPPLPSLPFAPSPPSNLGGRKEGREGVREGGREGSKQRR